VNKAGDIKQEPQVVFEYSKDPIFRSAHADGFIGGLTPNGHMHLAFFSERSLLPKKHIYKLNLDGSLYPEIPDEKASHEPIVRDIQVDVLMTVQPAEGLKTWLDQYIKNLKSRASSASEMRGSAPSGMVALSTEIGRAGATQ